MYQKMLSNYSQNNPNLVIKDISIRVHAILFKRGGDYLKNTKVYTEAALYSQP